MVFVSLLAPKGKGKEAINYLKKLKAPKGIKIQNIYVTMGRYDAVMVFEAANVKAAMNFAMTTGLSTDYAIETLTAVPVKEV